MRCLCTYFDIAKPFGTTPRAVRDRLDHNGCIVRLTRFAIATDGHSLLWQQRPRAAMHQVSHCLHVSPEPGCARKIIYTGHENVFSDWISLDGPRFRGLR